MNSVRPVMKRANAAPLNAGPLSGDQLDLADLAGDRVGQRLLERAARDVLGLGDRQLHRGDGVGSGEVGAMCQPCSYLVK